MNVKRTILMARSASWRRLLFAMSVTLQRDHLSRKNSARFFETSVDGAEVEGQTYLILTQLRVRLRAKVVYDGGQLCRASGVYIYQTGRHAQTGGAHGGPRAGDVLGKLFPEPGAHSLAKCCRLEIKEETE